VNVDTKIAIFIREYCGSSQLNTKSLRILDDSRSQFATSCNDMLRVRTNLSFASLADSSLRRAQTSANTKKPRLSFYFTEPSSSKTNKKLELLPVANSDLCSAAALLRAALVGSTNRTRTFVRTFNWSSCLIYVRYVCLINEKFIQCCCLLQACKVRLPPMAKCISGCWSHRTQTRCALYQQQLHQDH
jgi:hypothetical protein